MVAPFAIGACSAKVPRYPATLWKTDEALESRYGTKHRNAPLAVHEIGLGWRSRTRADECLSDGRKFVRKRKPRPDPEGQGPHLPRRYERTGVAVVVPLRGQGSHR